MIDETDDAVDFDEIVARALAELTTGPIPRTGVRTQLMARVSADAAPSGFVFRLAAEEDWLPYPVAGIRMKVLATNRRSGYATLLLDVAPGVRFPAHDHGGDEECYVLSGSVHTLGRRLGPGDFLHADAGTNHSELWTPDGALVLLIVPSEDVPVQADRRDQHA
jgi:anti-sigma factor ChrR (cupin superfamily)